MFTRRNILIALVVVIFVGILYIITVFSFNTEKQPQLISKDKIDNNQNIITYNNLVYYISTDGLLKQISDSTVNTIGSINTDFSPSISYDGTNVSYINPNTRELTVFKTNQQGSGSSPIIKANGVAFAAWQDEVNLIYLQYQDINNKYDTFYDPEDTQPNIKGTIYSVNINTKTITPIGNVNIQNLLLANPKYLIYSYRESANTFTINKYDLNTKKTSLIAKKNLSHYKVLNNNNLLIESPTEDYPYLIKNAELIQLKIPTSVYLISSRNNTDIKSTFNIVKKKDINEFSKTTIDTNNTEIITDLDKIITNPINLAVLEKQLIVFTQDGVYLINSDKVKE